jgi:DNA-directed RNA polymerase specialized sigma24 family protein
MPPEMDWDSLDRLPDEELIDALIGASLAERSHDRDRLMEMLRSRFDDVPRIAFRQTCRKEALEEEFVAWFWTYDRLQASLKAYRRTNRHGKFREYLLVKANWLRKDFHRRKKRRPAFKRFEDDAYRDERARSPGSDNPYDVRLESLRTGIERLRPTIRVPFKLVHIAALDLTDEDWLSLVACAGRPRRQLEATIDEHRRARRPLTLSEVGAIMGMKLHTVGTYVARAQREIKDWIRRCAEEGG